MSDELTTAMVNQKVEAHEKLCAERYAGIHDKITDLKKFLGYVVTVLVAMFIATLGWSLQQQAAAQKATNEALQTRIELLQSQSLSKTPTRAETSS
jgi:K+-sensing histidine kinase KdpD